MYSPKYTNELIQESSPYLLQHAHNPVNWFPWSSQLLEKAKRENKLLLISIGYATCHWCHVMEQECFEDVMVAELMNTHFINIKIDREERPDIDRYYMDALLLMAGNGGWPLHVIAVPDGRPVWGGTYFPKEQWMSLLAQIYEIFQTTPEKMYEYAEKLSAGIYQMNFINIPDKSSFRKKIDWKTVAEQLMKNRDEIHGGEKKVPKFMMPVYWQFVMRYAHQTHNQSMLNQVMLTLEKMAHGGIFDHVNGGFSRYSVDERWHIPHFEKMLYDNAQLVSLYSQAFALTGNALFKETVYKTLRFVKNELTADNGGFYSALDADSINKYGISEEGNYYVFTKEELQHLIPDDFNLFADYYNINDFGYWEDGKYVLIRKLSDEAFCSKHSLGKDLLFSMKKKWKNTLSEIQKNKEKPTLDYKVITSWNALMIKGYTNAYRVFGEEYFLDAALKNAWFIGDTMLDKNGNLPRIFSKGKISGNGFLDDYAFVISAYIRLYETTFDHQWVEIAKKLTQTVMDDFLDAKTGLFFYTPQHSEKLFAYTFETSDNVIPSSNAVMAQNLFWLGRFYNNKQWAAISEKMLYTVNVEQHPALYTEWLQLAMNLDFPFFEIAICGEKAIEKGIELKKHYLPHTLICGSIQKQEWPLLKNRYVEGKTLIYLCQNNQCKLPEEDVKIVIEKTEFLIS